MPAFRLAMALFLFAAAPADAVEPSAGGDCLPRSEQQAAVAAKRAISLSKAVKAVREKRRSVEVVRARLCRQGEGLVYVLTVLGRNGKVTLANVDAASGEVTEVR